MEELGHWDMGFISPHLADAGLVCQTCKYRGHRASLESELLSAAKERERQASLESELSLADEKGRDRLDKQN